MQASVRAEPIWTRLFQTWFAAFDTWVLDFVGFGPVKLPSTTLLVRLPVGFLTALGAVPDVPAERTSISGLGVIAICTSNRLVRFAGRINTAFLIICFLCFAFEN